MSENKTQPIKGSVEVFINAVEHKRRREDAQLLLPLLSKCTGLEPQLWGSGLAGKPGSAIVGFGRYAYTYESGRSGEFFMTGFSPRKANTAIYVLPGFKQYEKLLANLGPHKHSVSCLYLTNLAKNDLGALEEILRDAFNKMKSSYEWWPK